MGAIGTATNPITIDRSTGDWSLTNLSITAGGAVYLATADAGAHTAIPAMFANIFSVEKQRGDIVLSADLSRSTATIVLRPLLLVLI